MKTNWIITLSIIISCCVFMFSCVNEDETSSIARTYTQEQYEQMFKEEVKKEFNRSGLLRNSFLYNFGFPAWNNLKWVEKDGNKMITVPLVCSKEKKRVIVGVVNKYKIKPYVTEISKNDLSTRSNISKKMKVYDINLYNNGIPRSRNTEGEMTALLKKEVPDGSAENLYYALENSSDYHDFYDFGNIFIKTTKDFDSSSSYFIGHAWIEIETSEERVTFSLFGNKGSQEYWVNEELDYHADESMSKSIHYYGFQNILDYNEDSSNIDWSADYNCAGYSVGVWNIVDANKHISIYDWITPKSLANYIRNH